MDDCSRRDLLKLGAFSAFSFLGGRLAFAQDGGAAAAGLGEGPALIVVWLRGGPSQLDTFDPHPGSRIAGPAKAIKSSIPGVQLDAHYPRLAEQLHHVSLIRSLTTKEGEHQRGVHILRTGYAPLPTVSRPSLSAVVAHELQAPGLEIPRHVALLGNQPPVGGFLGAELNAFSVGDPAQPIEDLVSPVGAERFQRRLDSLDTLERGFLRGRRGRVEGTQHHELAQRARAMMRSEQMTAFQVDLEPASTRAAYGENPFGRACLAARRLVETGVPAIEVELDGWDSHVNNAEVHANLSRTLDQALSALLADLAERDLLRRTVIACGGEFGRTPRINALEGRDHWTRGFTWLLGGRGLRAGVVLGETDPEGQADPSDPIAPRDMLATLYQALGVDQDQEYTTAAGRPVLLGEGTPIARLLT